MNSIKLKRKKEIRADTVQLAESLGFEEDTTKKKQKKNFIDPFNRLELANQVLILPLTPHERDWGSSSHDLMKVACAKTKLLILLNDSAFQSDMYDDFDE